MMLIYTADIAPRRHNVTKSPRQAAIGGAMLSTIRQPRLISMNEDGYLDLDHIYGTRQPTCT